MNFYLLLEDSTSKFVLEDSSGDILLETPPVPSAGTVLVAHGPRSR